MFDTPGIVCLCISECTCPSVCKKFYFKLMDRFSLNGEVHFLSWFYTNSALSTQNIDLNDVLFLSSLQFLFIVSAVVDCYHRNANLKIHCHNIAVCECECVGVCKMCMHVCVYAYHFYIFYLLICLHYCCCGGGFINWFLFLVSDSFFFNVVFLSLILFLAFPCSVCKLTKMFCFLFVYLFAPVVFHWVFFFLSFPLRSLSRLLLYIF